MILILGVTASGKGRLAFDLAQSLDAEIISIDSMKVYRRMDIGTAKPPQEARRQIKYHLIDIIEPSDSFSVGAFREAALGAIEQIKGRMPYLVLGYEGSDDIARNLLEAVQGGLVPVDDGQAPQIGVDGIGPPTLGAVRVSPRGQQVTGIDPSGVRLARSKIRQGPEVLRQARKRTLGDLECLVVLARVGESHGQPGRNLVVGGTVLPQRPARCR